MNPCKRFFHSIIWFFQLCGMTLSMCWRGYISHKGWSALVHGIGLIIGYLGDYVVLYSMIMNFPGIGGFNALDVCFLYSMGLVCYALGNIHTREFWKIDDLVLRGGLDLYLVRPVSPLVQMFVRDIQVGYISHLILGLGCMFMVKGMSGISWTIIHWILFFFSILAGSVVMSGISLIATPLSFWWGKSRSVTGFIRGGLRETLKYPVTIYPKFIQLLVYIIPYAFVAYYPCLYLLGKDTSSKAVLYPLISMLVGAAANFAFWILWRLGLKKYNSAGG